MKCFPHRLHRSKYQLLLPFHCHLIIIGISYLAAKLPRERFNASDHFKRALQLLVLFSFVIYWNFMFRYKIVFNSSYFWPSTPMESSCKIEWSACDYKRKKKPLLWLKQNQRNHFCTLRSLQLQNFKMQPLNKIILVLLDSKCCAMTYDSENICVLRRK